MKLTVLFLAALIAAVAWFTHEPVRDELAAPIEVITSGTVTVAEASSATVIEDQTVAEADMVDRIVE